MPADHDPSDRADFPFVGFPTFLRSVIRTDLETLDSDIAVLGVPTDEGSPFMPGSRFGPRAIREHSLRFVTDPPGYYDPETRRRFLEREMQDDRLVDVGDADVLPTNVIRTFDNVTSFVGRILRRGAMPVVLGGDHSITYPIVRAYDEPLHILHFDAHIDYMPFVHGLEFTNQHAFRHIRRLPNVRSLTQVGIRSLRGSQVMLEDTLRDGNRLVTMSEFRDAPKRALLASIPEGEACYVSIDVDVLDLPLVPGCVSAEPNGMQYAELRDALFAVAEHAEVIGFDLVEVNPQLDIATGITSYLAAHTIIEFLGRICEQPRWTSARAERRGERGTVAR